MKNENYVRMLTLFIPFLDHRFFNIYLMSKRELKNEILISLINRGQISNLDMAESIINFYYAKDAEYNVDDFFEILEKAALSLLTYHHNQLCVDMFDIYDLDESKKYENFYQNKILDYFELNKFIADSLLTALYNHNHNYDVEYCIQNNLLKPISVVNHQLDILLHKGIAETHTHVVGSIPFEQQWDWIACEIYDNSMIGENLLKRISSHESIQFQQKSCGYNGDIVKLLKSAMLIRLLIMIYLVVGDIKKFDTFLIKIENSLDDLNKSRLYSIVRGVESAEYLNKLNDLDFKALIESLQRIIYRQIMFSQINDMEHYFSERLYRDFIKKFGFNNKYCSKEHVEYILQYQSIDNIKKNNDNNFKKAFLYYIRVKNFIHSFITQSTDIKGFLEFQHFFKSQNAIYDIPSNMFSNIFQTYLYENVKFLEIRIGHINLKTINNKYDKFTVLQDINVNGLKVIFYKTIKTFIKAYLQFLNVNETLDVIPQAGLILHFNKRYDHSKKCWDSYFRTYDDSFLRYKEFQEECFLNLIIFQEIRNELPYGQDYLIGIDGASNELLTEPWVLAPVFRSVKDRYSNILKNKAKNMYGIELQLRRDVGITYHVGEVFHSIASGLRHIDEVIDYYGFQNGERIGHGTILGVSIDNYISQQHIISLPAIELLDNLLWLYHLKSSHNLFNNISISYFEEELWKIIHYIYNDESGHLKAEITIHHLYKSYRKQFDELGSIHDIRNEYECNNHIMTSYCVFKVNKHWDENLLLLSRHCRCFLEKMSRIVQINVDNGIIKQIYEEAQQYLINKVSHKGIIIETNPVSNVNIGEIYGMQNHPIFALNDSFDQDYNRVLVSINTDDPGVFSTTLRNQYGFIQQMLYDRGIPMEKALQWIDRARGNGLNSSFLNKKIKSKEQIKKELNEIIEHIDKKII